MENRFKVVISDFVTDSLLPEREVLGDIAEIHALDAYHEDDLVGRIEDAHAVIVFHHIKITERTLAKLYQCEIVSRCGVGFDNVDHIFARERGIPVANVPDYGTEEVADSAIGMMLAMTRGFSRLNTRLQSSQGEWTYLQAAPLHRLRGRVLGIVGLGRIGSATAVRAKALGMDVAFYDPYIRDGYDKAMGIRRVESLRELLEQSMVVSLHCPLTDETRRMINSETLEHFKVGSYLVNTARGEVVDTTIIADAIEHGRLAGAAIDVLPNEPPLDDDPLLVAWRHPNHPTHDRVIIAPHVAFYCEEGLHDMRIKAALNCRRALLGERLRNVVN